jgi:hypothetical protein
MSPEMQKTVLRLVSIFAVTAVILAFNANEFDETEFKVLGWLGGFLGIGGIAEAVLGAKK